MSATSIPERRYALTKVGPGDWMLPSNDASTVWRIASYEDGPSHGVQDWPRDRTVWALWRWTEPVGPGGFVDTGSWDRWERVADTFLTRREAIDEAMRIGG